MDSKTMLALARRIARHKAPPIMRRKVDRALLTKSTDHLLRVSTDVLIEMKCSPVVN
jgi:hypothetical protein